MKPKENKTITTRTTKWQLIAVLLYSDARGIVAEDFDSRLAYIVMSLFTTTDD